MLNPPQEVTEEPFDVSSSPYIPLLDYPIQDVEVVEAAETCKEPKTAIFQCLPPIWTLFITQPLNIVFSSDHTVLPLK